MISCSRTEGIINKIPTIHKLQPLYSSEGFWWHLLQPIQLSMVLGTKQYFMYEDSHQLRGIDRHFINLRRIEFCGTGERPGGESYNQDLRSISRRILTSSMVTNYISSSEVLPRLEKTDSLH